MILFLRWQALACVFVLVACTGRAAGSGLTASYFDNADFTVLTATTVDPQVSYDYGAGAPRVGMGTDTFSIRWQGQVEVEFSETYVFYVTADDGFRLWVDGRLVMARTVYSTEALEMAGRVELKAGQRYNICLEFIENTGAARVKLEWASASQPRQVIPQARLYPTIQPHESGSILAETWSELPGSDVSALTASPNYPLRPGAREFLLTAECLVTNWADNYGTRVSGWVVPPTTGTYTFAVAGDDSVQLFFSTNMSAGSKVLIASNSAPTAFRDFAASPGQVSAPINLVAHEKYYVEVLHKESSGADHYSLAWHGPGDTGWAVIAAEHLIPAGVERTPPAASALFNTLAPSHPRLYATPQRFEWVRRLLASNSIAQMNTWWNSISNSASGLLSQPVVEYVQDERSTILGISREAMSRMYRLAFTYHMTGNTNFAERAWAELSQVASTNFPDWHPAHFLDTAEMTHACAIGYDWLYNYWTPARRDTIRNAIVTKGLNPSLTLYTNNSGWVRSSANNWNLVCNGGMVLGALAIGAENEALAEYVVSKALSSASLVMRRYAVDNGAWYEGPGYWSYTTEYNFRLMAGLESALGSDFGMSDVAGTSETGLEPIYMVGPAKMSFNFADAGAGNIRGPQLFWLGRRYNRPEYSAWERANGSANALDLLWYDTRGGDPKTMGMAPDNYFRGITQLPEYPPSESLTLRTRWQDADATFVGLKGGEIGADHGNLDAGTFVLDALGNRWAHDLGGDSYALPGYFSEPQRWTYYRMRAEGQNTLVINPGSAADQVVNVVPPVVLFTSEPNGDGSSAVVNLTGAYTIRRVWRGIQLLKQRRWCLVQDEMEAAAPANGWWFMHFHTNTAAEVSSDRRSVMMSRGADRLWVGLISSNGTFAVSNAVPLPGSPNPAGQNANLSYRKLALRFTGVTNTTLAVLMVPLRPGEPVPSGAQLPSIIPLARWGAATTNVYAGKTNSPPAAHSTSRVVSPGVYTDFNLRLLANDIETRVEDLRFTVGPATNGTVALLPDGYTARFTPLQGNQGPASFRYAVQDTWPDGRLLIYYDFEGSDTARDGYVLDRSSSERYGQVTTVGTGAATFDPDIPAALAPFSRSSLRLREAGDFNGGSVNGPLSPADFDFNRRSWTFSGWYKRAAATNDDFIFYLGNSDGFGSPDELHLHGAGSQNLSLVHYYGNTLSDLNITLSGMRAGEWKHVAVTFTSTNDNHGAVAFYVNGALAGTDPSVTLNMPTGDSPVFGGHANSGFAVTRWFNGQLDDCAFFSGALSAGEIAKLAQGVAAHLGGANVTNTVYLNVGELPPPAVLSMGVTNGQRHFSVSGREGFNITLQATPTLWPAEWVAVATNSGSGVAVLIDARPILPEQQFYRLLSIAQ